MEVGWTLDVELVLADVVDSLVVQHESNIGVLKQRVGAEDAVVGLHHSCGDLAATQISRRLMEKRT